MKSLDKTTERETDPFTLDELDNFFRVTFNAVKGVEERRFTASTSNLELPEGCTGLAVVTDKVRFETKTLIFSKRYGWTVGQVQKRVRSWYNMGFVPTFKGAPSVKTISAMKPKQAAIKFDEVVKVKPKATFKWQMPKEPTRRTMDHTPLRVEEKPIKLQDNHVYREYDPNNFTILKRLPDNYYDAIITDPPYNLGKQYKSGIDDKKQIHDYVKWCKTWVRECIRVMKPTGSFVIWLWPKYVGIIDYMLRFEFSQQVRFVQYLFWRADGRPMPSAKQHRIVVTPAIHYAGMADKGKGFYYNIDAVRESRYKSKVGDKHSTHILGKDPGNMWDDEESRHGNNWIREILWALHDQGYDFKDGNNPISYVKNIVWNRNDRFRLPDGTYHPCQMPISVVKRAMLQTTKVGDRILDPFGGTGTTLATALLHGRHGNTIEMSPDYINIQKHRMDDLKMGTADRRKYWPSGLPEVTTDPISDAKPWDELDVNLADFFHNEQQEASSSSLHTWRIGETV